MHETCTSEALGHPPLIDTLENRTLHKLSLIYNNWCHSLVYGMDMLLPTLMQSDTCFYQLM
jgi:hypothetical protein